MDLLSSSKQALLCICKHLLKPLVKKILPHCLHESCNVMGDIPGILIGISFLEPPPTLHGIKIPHKGAIGMFRPDKTGFRVKQVSPVPGLLHQFSVILFLSQTLGHLRHRKGAKAVFQSMGSSKIKNPAIGQGGIPVWDIVQSVEPVHIILPIPQVATRGFCFVLQGCFIS